MTRRLPYCECGHEPRDHRRRKRCWYWLGESGYGGLAYCPCRKYQPDPEKLR